MRCLMAISGIESSVSQKINLDLAKFKSMYSVAEENYIKSIYHLQRNNENATTNGLAAYLHTKPASVTDMLKKLEAKKLLRYVKYYGCQLTDEGNRIALVIIRRHRLWEFFLSEKLGFGWEEVHEIAEQLEHVQSALLTERLAVYLGNPKFDPHGDPIPDIDGIMAMRSQVLLSNWPLHVPGVVCGVGRQDERLLEMLRTKKLGIGEKLTVQRHFSFDNSLELMLEDGAVVTVSEQLANSLFLNSL